MIVLVMLSLMSCQMDFLNPSDEATIDAMDAAIDKELITVADLPSETQDLLETDYATMRVEEALRVRGLGYQVYMSTLRLRDSSSTCLYFNEEGGLMNGGVRHHHHGPQYGGYYYGSPCFELVFPITVIMPDNSLITGPDKDSVRTAIRVWYIANPDSLSRPTLQFPINILFDDSTTQVINTEAELIAARATCETDCDSTGRQGDRDRVRNRDHNQNGDSTHQHDGSGPDSFACFDLVYPVTYLMPDGSLIPGASEDSVHILIQAWRADNPGVRGKPELQFPVDIVFEDGATQTINDNTELRQAQVACRDDD